jgi:hypothetical protein
MQVSCRRCHFKELKGSLLYLGKRIEKEEYADDNTPGLPGFNIGAEKKQILTFQMSFVYLVRLI